MKESKNKKAFDGKSGGSVGIGLALGLAIGLMMGVATDNIPMWMCLGISIGLCCGTAFGVSGKGKPNSDNLDDEASKPIDPDDLDDEDLNEDTDQYN